jgi:hypothetical protein
LSSPLGERQGERVSILTGRRYLLIEMPEPLQHLDGLVGPARAGERNMA